MASLKRLLNYIKGAAGTLSRKLGRGVLWALGLLVLFCGLLWIGCVWADHWIASESGIAFVAGVLREATVSDVRIAAISANLPNRLAIENLEIKVPNGPDTYEVKPSIVFKHIEYQLALGKLFTGQLEVVRILIDGLEINAERRDGRLWIAEMLDRLNAKKAATITTPPPEQPPSEPMTLDKIRALMAQIVVPIKVAVREVGIKNVVVNFHDYQKNKLAMDLHLGPLHALLGLEASLAKSLAWVDIAGDLPQNALDVRFHQGKKISFDKKVNSHIRLDLKDLTDLTFSTDVQGTPVPLAVKIALHLSQKLDRLDIKVLDMTAGDVLTQRGYGFIQLLDDSLKRFSIEFADELSVNLSKVNAFLPAQLGTSIAGSIRLKKLGIAGDLDLTTLNNLPALKVPSVQLELLLEQLAAKAKGASVSQFGGLISLKTTTAPGGGIHVANDIDLSIDEVAVEAKAPSGTTKAKVQGLGLTTGIDVSNATSLPDTTIDRLSVALNAHKIAVTPPGKPTLSVPLKVVVSGGGKIATSSGHADIDATLGSLLSTSVKAGCTVQCNQVNADLKVVIAKLEDVFELVLPMLPPTANLPELKGGRLDVGVKAVVAVPPGKQSDLAKRFKLAKPKVDTKITLSKLGVSLVPQKVRIEGIGLDVETSGDLNRQHVKTNVTIDSVTAPQLPEPLKSTSFALDMSAEKEGVLDIQKMELLAPSVGTIFSLNAKTELGPDQMPQNVQANVELSVDPELVKVVPKSLSLKGKSKVFVAVTAPDLSNVKVRGNVKFENFGVAVKKIKDDGNEETLVTVDHLQGALPFQQIVNVKEILAAKKTAQIEAQKERKEAEAPDAETAAKAAEASFDAKLDQYLEKYASPTSNGSRMTTEYYGEVRPLYGGRKPLTIDRIQFRDLKFEKLEIDAELKQNQFSLNQMVIGLLGGKIYSGMQASFDTKLRDVNLAAQWTRLDTRKLADNFPKLRERMSGFSILSSSPYIDGTLKLKYDAVSGDIAGGMEITSIGKDQLKMILMYVDPEDKNPTIGSIRKALNVGEVRQVSVPIRNGQIGLDVDVRVLAAPIPTPKLQRFPLAQLVRNFTGNAPPPAEKSSESSDNQKIKVVEKVKDKEDTTESNKKGETVTPNSKSKANKEKRNEKNK